MGCISWIFGLCVLITVCCHTLEKRTILKCVLKNRWKWKRRKSQCLLNVSQYNCHLRHCFPLWLRLSLATKKNLYFGHRKRYKNVARRKNNIFVSMWQREECMAVYWSEKKDVCSLDSQDILDCQPRGSTKHRLINAIELRSWVSGSSGR